MSCALPCPLPWPCPMPPALSFASLFTPCLLRCALPCSVASPCPCPVWLRCHQCCMLPCTLGFRGEGASMCMRCLLASCPCATQQLLQQPYVLCHCAVILRTANKHPFLAQAQTNGLFGLFTLLPHDHSPASACVRLFVCLGVCV